MLSNIGGIEAAWRAHGAPATRAALAVLAGAFSGQVLRYAGTIFPGIAAISAADGDGLDVTMLTQMVGARSQAEWRTAIMRKKGEQPDLKFAAASAEVLSDAWDEWLGAQLEDAA